MSTNNRTKESTFDGSTLVEKLILIGCFLLTILTFGLALWYLVCTYQRWNTKHTVYDGKRLVFEGTGKNYFYTIFFGSFWSCNLNVNIFFLIIIDKFLIKQSRKLIQKVMVYKLVILFG